MIIASEILNRKGAIKASLIPSEVMTLLNKGIIESVNLVEWLDVDHELLLHNVLLSIDKEQYLNKCLLEIEKLKSKSTMKVISCIGNMLYLLSNEYKDGTIFEILSNHKSDSVRCWAAYMVGANSDLSISEKLNQIKIFAADTHFGVREIAWMAVRSDIIDNVEEAINVLSDWSLDVNAYVRRFASEATRPRGVWCKHIELLKVTPEMALPILESLYSDSDKYVRDSVANWLNDASKTNLEWVVTLTDTWSKKSKSKETQYIIKRALRTINKK